MSERERVGVRGRDIFLFVKRVSHSRALHPPPPASPQELERVRVDVHNEYFHAFREMYLTLGDLSYKKEKHLTEVGISISLSLCGKSHQLLFLLKFHGATTNYVWVVFHSLVAVD